MASINKRNSRKPRILESWTMLGYGKIVYINKHRHLNKCYGGARIPYTSVDAWRVKSIPIYEDILNMTKTERI